jgi:hypothetical protein
MGRVRVRSRINRDRAYSHIATRPYNPQRDFSTICNQDFFNETGREETVVEIKRKSKCKSAGRENDVRDGTN